MCKFTMPENTVGLNMDSTHDECVSRVVNVNRPYTSYTPTEPESKPFTYLETDLETNSMNH